MTTWNKYPEQNNEFIAHRISEHRKLLNECKPYSSWNQELTPEYTRIADEMLRKFNPNSKDNQWLNTWFDRVPSSNHQTLNTFGDDNRGLADGVGAAISEGAMNNDD